MSSPPTPAARDVEPPETGSGGAREARWVRPLLVVAVVAGLLLLGAAGGLLIGLPGARTPAAPAADSVDVGFAQDMTVHHQQAVEMAAWERDHTSDPELAQLAADIEATQASQIGRMQGWLELWGAASLPVGGHMAWMDAASHDHGLAVSSPTMPGMATPADLAGLRSATGPDLDVRFLQLMLRHHEGGRVMLEYGATHAAVPQVRNLAEQILRSQSSENDYLRQLLAERGGAAAASLGAPVR